MSYQIRYGKNPEHIPKDIFSGIRIVLMTASFFLAFCMLVNSFWPQGRTLLGNLLFPGGAEPAMAAAEVFVEELRNGEPISEALEHFCRDIVSHTDHP